MKIILVFFIINIYYLNFNKEQIKKVSNKKYVINIKNKINNLKIFKTFINTIKNYDNLKNISFIDYLINYWNKNKNNFMILFNIFFSQKINDSIRLNDIFNLKDNKSYILYNRIKKFGTNYRIYYPIWLANDIYLPYDNLLKSVINKFSYESKNIFYKKYILFYNNEFEIKYDFILNFYKNYNNNLEEINNYNPYFIYSFYPELFMQEKLDFDKFKYILFNEFNYNYKKLTNNDSLISLNKKKFSINLKLNFNKIYFNLMDSVKLIIMKNLKKQNIFNFSPKFIYWKNKYNNLYFRNISKIYNIFILEDYTKLMESDEQNFNVNAIFWFNKIFGGFYTIEFYNYFYLIYLGNLMKLNLKKIVNQLNIDYKDGELICVSKSSCKIYTKILLSIEDNIRIKSKINYINEIILPILKFFMKFDGKSDFNLYNLKKDNIHILQDILIKNEEYLKIEINRIDNIYILSTLIYYVLEKSINSYSKQLKIKLFVNFKNFLKSIIKTLNIYKIKMSYYIKNKKKGKEFLYLLLNMALDTGMLFYKIKKYFFDSLHPLNFMIIIKIVLNMTKNITNFNKKAIINMLITNENYIIDFLSSNKEINNNDIKNTLINYNKFFSSNNDIVLNTISNINISNIKKGFKLN